MNLGLNTRATFRGVSVVGLSRGSMVPVELGHRLLVLALTVGFGLAMLVVPPPPKVAAAACDVPTSIACENTLPGNPSSEWDIAGAGSASIQGFATDISVNRGSTVGFKVKTTATSYRLDIYRMGYYGGAGARKITTVTPSTYLSQPACKTQSSSGLVDCGNWTQTAKWDVPATAVAGIYFAKLVAGTAASHITFVVRNDASQSDLLFQTSDTTWQAYNTYGGNSLYVGAPANRAYKVSYNRPFNTNSGTEAHDFVWNAEYPMVRFLEANGYDVSYTTGVDTERRGDLIKNHKTFLSVGHDEYWSGTQRAKVEAARDAGVNLAFFSGNEVFWKTRYENSLPTAGDTAYRTLVTYKETMANAKIDPAGAATWTGTWRDPRFSPPGDGGRPENSLTGQLFRANCCTTDMEVDGIDGQLRLWRNTRVANLSPTQSTVLGSDILGYEWDESPANGSQPAGLVKLSTTTRSGMDALQDYGSTYGSGTVTHHLSLYRAASGALVFGAGTVQWAWGLDNNHTSGGSTADAAVRQATVNLFADLGAQPATLQSGLTAATASTDVTAPTSTITAPAAGATVPTGQSMTISGTAVDTGGRVGAVEVSLDNGASWQPAKGRGSWSYTYTPGTDGQLVIRSRATDDSLRMETPAAGRTITVGSGPAPPGSCPCSIWPGSAGPVVAADPDNVATEVGVTFRANQAGYVTGVRFFKGVANTGTHVGSLWSAAGTKLGSATFSNESSSGWQQVQFSSPVAVTANASYVVSYFAPSGHYAADENYFGTPTSQGPLTALQDTTGAPNGVYRYGTAGFPSTGYRASNYWVDVIFTTTSTDTTKPTVVNRQPASGATAVSPATNVVATFSEPVTAVSISVGTGTGTAVTGSSNYDPATQRLTFTPASTLAVSTSYTVTVSGAKDAAGNIMNDDTWTFTTAAAPPADTTPPSITGRTPASAATNVAVSTGVSVTFSEDVQGSTIGFTLGPDGSQVTGTSAYSTGSRTFTFTPGADLAAATTYMVTVSGVQDGAGNTMATTAWTFTTAPAAGACPCTIWPGTATPAVAAEADTAAVNVGVKFRATRNGSITGLRFYKGPGNTGTHVGSLWSRTGSQLATATFTGETATGWQQVMFATPVAVTANTTYVASYRAPVGRYSMTENAFSAATTRGPLTALQNGTDGVNGVYRYGAAGFPSTGYNSTNYWVDVVFQ